jgi:hypothetical protein
MTERTAARERREANSGLRVTTLLAEVDAAEWRAIAATDTCSVRALSDATSRLEAAHESIDFDVDADTTSFDSSFPAYIDAIHCETELLAGSRIAEAHADVDPAHQALRDAVDEAVADQEQPAADARRMLAAVRARNPNVYVVCASVYPKEEASVEADAFLVKRVSLAGLRSALPAATP